MELSHQGKHVTLLNTFFKTHQTFSRLWSEQDEIMRHATLDMLDGDVHPAFLYLTPESFYNTQIHDKLMRMYRKKHISRLVFDEVQVILEVST